MSLRHHTSVQDAPFALGVGILSASLFLIGLAPSAARAQCGLPSSDCTGALHCGGSWDFESGFVWGPHDLAGECSPDDGDNQACCEPNRQAHVGSGWTHWAEWPTWPVSGYYGFANFNENKNCANVYRGNFSQEITLTCANGVGGIYRQAAVPVNHTIRVTAEMKFTPNNTGTETDQYLGLDPTGGTNPNAPSVVWTPWDTKIPSPPQPSSVFNHTEEEIVSTSSTLTIFIKHVAWVPICQGQTFMLDDVRVYDLGPVGPAIERTPAQLAPTATVGTDANADTFTVRNSGAGTLNYTVNDNANWLSLNPTSGASTGEPDTIDVTYDTDTLATGSYLATITISDPNATNHPQTIGVNLTIGNRPGDYDGDGDVDGDDFGKFQRCLSGAGNAQLDPACAGVDLDGDLDVDQDDYTIFALCMSGANVPSDAHCH